MMLGTKARYAVMAMVELALRQGAGAPDKLVTLADIAAAQDIPLAYLEQIFVRLKKADLVAATRGPGGGYTLNGKGAAITIAEIIDAAEESLKITRCGEEAEHGCMASHARCATHDLWEGLEQKIGEYLRTVTLGEVARRELPRLRA